MDFHFLRSGDSRDVALDLHKLASERPDSLDTISGELLQAITSGSLPPSTFALWTSACPDGSATVAGMRCSDSIIVRSSAIRSFRRRLRTADCEQMWRALGGIEGVIALLAEFSVIHVKEFCKAVARCSTSTHAKGERQLLVTDLLQSLMSASQQPGTGHHGFMDQYAKLVYTCTPDFRNDWIAKNGSSKLDMRKLIECDTARYQDECLQAITNYNPSKTPRLNVYLPLLKSIPGIPHSEDSSVSESMAFSVRALKAVSQANVSEMWKDRAWLDDAIRSLLKRIVRRKTPMRKRTMKIREISTLTKVSTTFALEALEAISQCLQQDPGPGEVPYGVYQTPEDHRHWRNILHLWRRDPSIYEAALTPLLQAYNFRVELKASGYRLRHDSRAKITITQQILATHDEQRYSLLRFLLANQSGYRFDIENCSQVAGKADRFYPMDDILPVEILLALPSADALPLLERFHTYCPGKLSLNVNGLNVLDREPRVELLRLHLRDDVEAVFYDAKRQTKRSQQIAENSGAQPVRSAWITASIHFAVASQSPDLLKEVVIWARRFSRDPKTVVELCGEGKAFEDERTLRLLSGIPSRFDPDASVHESEHDVQQSVRKGNEVMLTLLQSAIEAQSDSSFKPWHWESVKLLFRRVVGLRLTPANSLQGKLYLTDEATFDCIWKDTIKLLIQAEELGLSPDNASLELCNTSGLLNYGHNTGGHAAAPKDFLSPATLRFIDELAVLRDRLWTTHRSKECPAVTALQPTWNRGLPLQALLFPHGADLARHYLPEQGWNVGVAANAMPFLEKRATDVVFMAPEHALASPPADEKTIASVGTFIDDYSLALYIYVALGKEDERQQRLQDAWTHATQNLSGSRLSKLESAAYWREPFAAARAHLPTSTKDHEPVSLDLRLPMMNQNSISPVEWSPQPQVINAALSSKVLEPLVIDCFAKPPAAWPSKGPANTIQGCKPSLSSIDITNVWDVKSLMGKGIRVPKATKEALIAAALLLVDGRSQTESNIFSEPYPSTTAPRFPAMVLDAQLLDSKEPSDENVIAILERFMPTVPASLLHKLTSSLVRKSLDASPTSKALREWTSSILELLVKSDHIDIATEQIPDVILEAPGETSWHRILLHSGTLRRLSHDKCKKLMQKLFDGIIARLQKQARIEAAVTQADKIETTPGSYTPSTSLVKVTTVKMLAHLLKDSTFLGERFIIDCLFAVFEAATHIYVRATVVDSLSTVLTSSRDENIRTQIMDGLVEKVVPVAAELNERAPMTEDMWAAAEDNREPPEVLNGSRGGLGPIGSSLVNFFQDSPPDVSYSNGFAEQIMKPLIERSQENNSRWTNIFLRKHNASHLEPLIPRCPAKPGLLRIMLDNYTSNMEVSIFKNLSEALLFATHPPQGIIDFAKQLKAQPEFDKKSDVNHWLHFTTIFRTYDHGVSSALKKAKFAPADVATKRGLLTCAQLQEHEQKAFQVALDAFDTDPQAWIHYLNYYKPPVQSSSDSQLTTNWRERCRPVLQHALRLVERSRTGMWQLDPNRHPSVLPDTFEPELWLLTYPNLYPPAQHTGCLNAFCGEIRKIIEQLASSSRPYHARYNTLLKAISHCDQEDWMAIALYLGDLELLGSKVGGAPLTRAELLCIDAAAHVLDEIRKQSRERDLKPAKAMLESWTGCADEEVRRKGRELMAWL